MIYRSYRFKLYPNRTQKESLEKIFNSPSSLVHTISKENTCKQKISYKPVNKEIGIRDNCIYIRMQKIGFIKMKPVQKITGKVIRISIIKESTDKYYLSVLYCQKENYLAENHSLVIITRTKSGDIYLSSGIYIDKEDLVAQHTKRLKYEEARQEKLKNYCTAKRVDLNQAKNYQKQKKKVIRLQNRLYRKREDYLHKLTIQLVKKYQFIVIPTYDEESFLYDSFWFKFVEKLSYKCTGYGRTLQQIRLSKEETHLSHGQQIVYLSQQLKKTKI